MLVLSSTLSVGERSPEVEQIRSLGYEPEIVAPEQWRAKSAAEFASYRALVLGDAACGGDVEAAVATARTWGSQVTGNAIVLGTDPVFHDDQGGRGLTDAGIAYATARPGRTGAYIALSCYFHDTAAATPVPLLAGLSSAGGFTVRGVGCYDDAHLTADDDALPKLTDATLSGWGCSVHEAFDEYPSDFVVLAIARDIGATYTAPDGSVGTPYILARGSGTSYRGRGYVALGDSVAAGEGIAYEFRWSRSDERWIRDVALDATWDTGFTNENCHQTPAAYPRATARLLGADLLHLACTGASARDGVLTDRRGDGWSAPAQLGSSLPGFAPPNPRYDAAAPDIVSLSLGANDLDFADRVSACYKPALGGCDTDPEQLDAPLAMQKIDLGLVLDEIARRAPAGKVPFTVLTEYVDPFPEKWTDSCPDLDLPLPGIGLSKRELDYLRGGLERLNANIREVAASRGAVAIEAPAAFERHRFCSDDPWTFGPSIRTNNVLGPDVGSPAPFHPTVAGQDELGRAVAAIVRLKLPVYPGPEVEVSLPEGDLHFDEIARAGEVAILPEGAPIPPLPPADGFRKAAGYEVVSSAEFSGEVEVALPASEPLSLFHYEGGRWVEVPSRYEDGHVSGRVSSLSPFALGTPVSRVNARIEHSEGGRAPVTVAFDGSGSGVADGSGVAAYAWDFGDGTRGAGPVPRHVYDQSGTYGVKLTVTASNGAVDTASATVRVTNAAPRAVVEGPSSVAAGEPLRLASASRDANGRIGETAWAFGDGSDPATGERVEHVYRRPGSYVVRLQVADDEGEEAEVAFPVTVTAPPEAGGVGGSRAPAAGPDHDHTAGPDGNGPSGGGAPARAGARLRVGRRLRWGRGRQRLLLHVRCASTRARCDGRVELRLRARPLASSRLRLAGGRRATLRLRPRARLRRRISSARGATVTVRVRFRDGRSAAFSTRLVSR